jgi:hypothetical protein
MGCGGGGGGRGRARSGSQPSGRLFLMYPATWAKCASVASHIDPVKLRTSFEYPASFAYVSESQSQMSWSYSPPPKSAGHHSTCLKRSKRCSGDRTESHCRRCFRVFQGCLRRSSQVRKCTTSSTDSRNDPHTVPRERHQTRLCATLSVNV